MTGRRKGTPCACETDPCSCGSSKGKCIRTINNLSPDPNGDFFIEAGSGITITQTSDNGFEVSFDGTLPSNPLIYKGTVGSGGTVAVLPAADPDNIGWMFIAIEAATSPVTYEVGDTLISDGYTWQVIPSGDDPVDWSQILNTPTTLAGYGITDAMQEDTTPGVWAYTHSGVYQGQTAVAGNAAANSLLSRDSDGCGQVADPAADTDSDYAVNVRTLNRRLTDGSVSKIGTVNVGTDTKPIKLVNGIPAAVTNDLVDLPSAQAITGVKSVPLEATGTFSGQIASSNKVKNELDNYTPMVRTTGNQTISGLKKISSLGASAGAVSVTSSESVDIIKTSLGTGNYTYHIPVMWGTHYDGGFAMLSITVTAGIPTAISSIDNSPLTKQTKFGVREDNGAMIISMTPAANSVMSAMAFGCSRGSGIYTGEDMSVYGTKHTTSSLQNYVQET